MENSQIKIFPSYEELNPNKEEILIIFQGLNIFLDLQEMITTDKKIEIENNKKSSIIVAIRVRPLIQTELKITSVEGIKILDSNSLIVTSDPSAPNKKTNLTRFKNKKKTKKGT